MQLLLQHIAQHVALTPEEKTLITSVLQQKKIKKKHFLLQEGEVQRSLYYVTAGCLRSYAIDKNGFEHVLQFAPTGWWIGDMHSITTQAPALLSIDAVEDSELLLLPTADLEKLHSHIPQLNKYFRLLAERSLATYQHRLIDTLSLTAIERYTNFCKRYPTLITQLPQKQVAAYIGVTPEFLSRMLRERPNKT